MKEEYSPSPRTLIIARVTVVADTLNKCAAPATKEGWPEIGNVIARAGLLQKSRQHESRLRRAGAGGHPDAFDVWPPRS